MAASHGKDTYFGIGDSALPGTADDVSTYCRSVDVPRSADTAESSTFGATSKTKVPGLLDGTISIEGPWDPTMDARMAGILGLKGVAFEYGPAGDTGGYVKYSGNCICTGYNVSGDIGDVAVFSAEFELDDDVTIGTF